MDVERFSQLMQPVAAAVEGRTLDAGLAADLNRQFPVGSDTFAAIESACHAAIEAGWMCAQGGPGRRFGRVIEATPDSHGLSVDVVDLENVVGPHHRHPTGEVCMVMPVAGEPNFDGNGAGWCVYEPGSEHFPTVAGGRALVLYLLPDGQIEFTGKPAPESH